MVSNRDAVLPPDSCDFLVEIEIDDLNFAPAILSTEATRNSLNVDRTLGSDTHFLSQVDILCPSLFADFVLEACGCNRSEALCQSVLDGMDEFDGYEKKSLSICAQRSLLFINNKSPASRRLSSFGFLRWQRDLELSFAFVLLIV